MSKWACRGSARSLQVVEGIWLRGKDLNLRPLGYEPNELPDCSTPQNHLSACQRPGQTSVTEFLRTLSTIGVCLASWFPRPSRWLLSYRPRPRYFPSKTLNRGCAAPAAPSLTETKSRTSRSKF